MRRWTVGVIAVLAIGFASLVLLSAYAQSASVSIVARTAYGHISVYGDERVGEITEVDVWVNWHKGEAATLVRLDGIPGWKTTRFAATGYESREFCDDDNVPEAIRLGPGSVVWGTGNLWPGASCVVRLFLIPTVPGTYKIHAHFIAGPWTNLRHLRSLTRVESDIRVTVAPWWGVQL